MGYTIEDYLFWRGDLPFESLPINEADEMLFACIGKPEYDGILPPDGTHIPFTRAFGDYLASNPGRERIGLLISTRLFDILEKAAGSVRYRDITVSGFINRISPEKTEQFSAITVHTPCGKHYVSFRGTDDTLIGWKEDCELAVFETVPAQRDALKYLEWQAAACKGELIVCGHSKGGNLAVYAAANADERIQARISRVYSYDGPGFMDGFMQAPGYLAIRDRVTTYVPEHSIVGMFMNCAGTMKVVSSEASGATAHDVFTWNIEPNGLKQLENLSGSSRIFKTAIDETLAAMDSGERQELVDEIFTLLSSTGAFQLLDLSGQPLRETLELASNFRKAPELRSFIRRLSELSIKEAVKSRIEQEKNKDRALSLFTESAEHSVRPVAGAKADTEEEHE